MRANASAGWPAAVAACAVGSEQVGDRPVRRVGHAGEHRVEVDLGELAFLRAVEQPGVEHPDHAATAQEPQLARDVAAEALGGLEPDENDLERADVGFLVAHARSLRARTGRVLPSCRCATAGQDGRAGTRAVGGAAHGVVRRSGLRRRRRDGGGDQDPHASGDADPRSPRRLPGRAPGAERRGFVSGGGLGLWGGRAAVWAGGRAICSGCWWVAWLRGRRWWRVVNGALRECGSGARAGSMSATRSCGAACPSRRSRGRWWTWPRCSPSSALARAFHEAGIRYGTTPAQVEAVLPRRPRSHGRGESARGHTRRRAGPAQLPRAALPAAAARGRPAVAGDEPAGRRAADRLLAGPSIA